jgi:hypothetical protein
MKFLTPTILLVLFLHIAVGQEGVNYEKPQKEYTYETFSATRIINNNSIETLEGKTMLFYVTHRFGDFYTEEGNVIHELFGLDQAADIVIGLDYGITNNLTVGLGRAKGAGQQRELWYAHGKYKFLSQTTDNKMPVSMAIYTNAVVSSMKKETGSEESAGYIENGLQRFSFFTELIIARKFNPWLSMQVSASYLHRNKVPFADENSLVSFGAAARIKVSKVVAFLVETYIPVSDFRLNQKHQEDRGVDFPYYVPFGVGVEFKTGKHVFDINFTNAEGILPNDYIPYTQKNWLDGGFRLGFTISREFPIGKYPYKK